MLYKVVDASGIWDAVERNLCLFTLKLIRSAALKGSLAFLCKVSGWRAISTAQDPFHPFRFSFAPLYIVYCFLYGSISVAGSCLENVYKHHTKRFIYADAQPLENGSKKQSKIYRISHQN